MSFLFKNKKPAPANTGLPPFSRKLSSRDGPNVVMPAPAGPQLEDDRSRSGSAAGTSTGGSLNGRSAPSPTPDSRQIGPRGPIPDPPRQAPRRPPHQGPPDASLYPWSNHRLTFYNNGNPFPRYGSSVNSAASKDGEIYMMGGLIDGQTVKGDLWIVEAGSQPMQCRQVTTTAEGPGPRVGHASLLVGNAFIVFGGDTKVDEHDILDDTLYLLNTSTKHWSRVAPAGPRPAGRYGHTLNIIGSKIYVFGGQVEGYFFNDLLAFDLNALQTSNSHWETLVQNSADGGPTQGQSPPARTNHTVITYDDKLYLFGGTDGINWFSDVWCYDPRINAWTQLECIGFIPAAREGQSAALVGDVMYVFGGRTEEGKDLGDVAGFRIPTKRWYTFQNMGPSPSPRSGHGMTAYDGKIYVIGGEPSSAPRDEVELSQCYVLDTTKIRYPEDKGPPKSGTVRRPSVSDRSGTPQTDRAASRDGSVSSQQGNRPLMTKNSEDSMTSSAGQYAPAAIPAAAGYVNGLPQRPTRSAPSPVPGQYPQQPMQQVRANGIRPGVQSSGSEGRESPMLNSKLDKSGASEATSRENTSAAGMYDPHRDRSGSQPPTSGPYNPQSQMSYGQQYSPPQQSQQQQPINDSRNRGVETPETGSRGMDDFMQSSFKQPTYADSGVGSSPALSTQQPDNIARELETARSKNAWYASELALAKKSGYRSSSLDSPSVPFDDRTTDAFGEEEKPLLEALLRMRGELVRVQQSLEAQSASAAERIAQVEREKEAAVAEALYARTQLNSRDQAVGGDIGASSRLDEANRRLASTLNAHNEFRVQIQSLSQALSAEKRGRESAEASADAAYARASDLDAHKQWSAPELENLRAQLHEAQRNARDDAASHADAVSSSRSLSVEKQELSSKLYAAQENQRSHAKILSTLRDAVQASSQKAALLEDQMELERQQRTTAEQKLAQLRSEHEARVSELDSTTRQLRDAQDLAESHAVEAKTHREAVMAGLGNVVDRDYDSSDANDERVNILQQQAQEATARAQELRKGVDSESDKRRRAEERIAGLEAFQEQQNRESLGLRKQLQSAARDHIALQGSHAELQQQLSKHKLDITAWQMQNEALKGMLGDRGVDTTTLSGDASDYQLNSSDSKRMQQLEEQIEASSRSQEEMRQTYESREQELRQTRDTEYRALEKECQQMRNGIEKFNTIAGQMKKELDKQKEKNRVLREELDQERRSRSVASSNDQSSTGDLEKERSNFRQLVDNLQVRLQKSQAEYELQLQQLQSTISERDGYHDESLRLQRELEGSRAHDTEFDALRAENSDLRTRTAEAESKVQMLLDTVGFSVNNYRRQSQLPVANGIGPLASSGHHRRDLSIASIGGESTYSSHSNDNGFDGNRNSLAQMEAMMNELDTIRGDFEKQRRGYSGRLSVGSVLEGPGPTADEAALQETGGRGPAKMNSLADMRRRHLSFDDDEEDLEEERTRLGQDAMSGKA